MVDTVFFYEHKQSVSSHIDESERRGFIIWWDPAPL